MARRIDINRIIQSQFVSDLPLIIAGCAIAAFATDAFMIPNGLAAGGLTGLATIIAELGRRAGISLPVGLQTIIMNALLLLVVVRSGGLKYVVQTVTGLCSAAEPTRAVRIPLARSSHVRARCRWVPRSWR